MAYHVAGRVDMETAQLACMLVYGEEEVSTSHMPTCRSNANDKVLLRIVDDIEFVDHSTLDLNGKSSNLIDSSILPE